MNRLRIRLIAVFLAATIAPLIMTLWIMTSLLERSLSYSTTAELDRISRSLEDTGRELYRQARESLRQDALANNVTHETFTESAQDRWPDSIAAFWESGEAERFVLAGSEGDRLDFLMRSGHEVWLYSRPLGIPMEQLSEQYRGARELVELAEARDLRRGFVTTLVVLVAAVWALSFGGLIVVANRMSEPIDQLTAGLSELSSGNLEIRIDSNRKDEIGRAIAAFNHTARQLQQSREHLVYLTQIASWQTLARKMAHELKNSLTPIRLTAEEILARQSEGDRKFLEQAVQIVVHEVDTLERRVRAFSQFSSEPAVRLTALDINTLLDERITFLQPAHPGVHYVVELAANLPAALADTDSIKGIFTNLLENAAEAAGAGGKILSRTRFVDERVVVEIHDSGPGLSAEAARTLFEPTITFKKHGMGLGLSIARRNALLCGGDLLMVHGELGGAGFRLVLPKAS